MRSLSIRTRWAVPVGVVAVTGTVIAAAAVASAAAVPSLPSRTPRQLLTEIAQGMAKPLGPLTATVQQTANLGFPALALPGQEGSASGPSAGPQSVTIWYRDPRHVRVAEQVLAGETDLRRDGRTLWVWNSKTQTATRYELPARESHGGSVSAGGSGPAGDSVPGTPSAAAAQLLTAIGPTTMVSVTRNVYVAGRAAYQLSLVPRSSKSLVGSVVIAIDARRHIPLRVEVFPRGSSTVAYSIGFTALSFGPPAASNFSFTPPSGATVKKVTVPGNLKSILGHAVPGAAVPGAAGLGSLVPGAPGAALGSLALGTGAHGSVKPATARLIIGKLAPAKLPKFLPALPPQVRRQIEAQFAKSLPASLGKARRAALIKAFARHLLGRRPLSRGVIAQLGTNAGPATAAPHIIGTGWLSVVATPPSPQVAAAVRLALHGGPSAGQSSPADSSAPAVSSPAGQVLAALPALLRAATQVHGTWGRGWLLHTALVNVLVTTKGQILAGAVTKSVLCADVAADAG